MRELWVKRVDEQDAGLKKYIESHVQTRLKTDPGPIFFSIYVPVILMAKGSFWMGSAVGFVLMVLLGGPLPVLGPLIGGLVAGLIAKGGIGNGAKAGFTAGIFGALVVIIIGVVVGTLAMGLFGFLLALGIGVILVATALYFAVLGCVGGAIGGLISK